MVKKFTCNDMMNTVTLIMRSDLLNGECNDETPWKDALSVMTPNGTQNPNAFLT
jgi:hypothetical protein